MKSEKDQVPATVSEKDNIDAAKEVFLFQNYPNPFSATTFISFTIPDSKKTGNHFQHVTLKIFDAAGNEISTILNDQRLPGYYDVEFCSGCLPKGIYYYELIVGSFHRLVRQMALVK